MLHLRLFIDPLSGRLVTTLYCNKITGNLEADLSH